MLGLILLCATAGMIVAGAVWAHRRWENVDSYYEREEHKDSHVADLGSYLNGGRW